MYLSSRFAAFVGITVVFAAGTVHAELAARSAFAGMRPTIVSRIPHFPYSGIAPTIVSRGRPGYGGYRGIRPTIVSGSRRGYRYGYGGGGLGYDGYETTDFGAAGLPGPGPGPSLVDAPPPFVFPPRPAPCPQIIEIGGGLAHKATTRVVFGSPCRR